MLDEPLLTDLFHEAVQASGAFGAQLSISDGHRQVDLAAGFADAERGVEMTTGTVLQIGSITKVFNASVVMSLVQDGLVSLDTPVREYIPGFKVADPHATLTLTPRHLLSMSSGLDNGRYVYFGDDDDALGRYVGGLGTLPQRFAPGRHFGYANAGTCIAGHMAATVAGKPWETLLRERIIEPAGLSSAIVVDEDLAGKHVSAGHYLRDDGPEIVPPTFSQDRSRGPSGACFALSTRDLARFGRTFLDGGRTDGGERILSRASVVQMMERQIGVPSRMHARAWCLGPWWNDWNGVQLWGHAGGTATSSSCLQWIPGHNGVIAFIINTGSAFVGFRKLAFTKILDAAFGFSKPALSEGSGGSYDPRRYAGTYEHLGARMHVTPGTGESLNARLVPQRTAEELAQHDVCFDQSEQSAVLTPLGQDRFLLNALDGPDIYQGEVDTAFFGDDGEGRATNVLDGVFAMSRTTDEAA